MFVVEVGSVLTTGLFVQALRWARARRPRGSSSRSRCGSGSPCCSPTSPRPWPRGAARRRPTPCAGSRQDTGREDARRAALSRRGVDAIPSTACCAQATAVLVEAGDIIPGDGEVIEGIASVDESAITGESAPVIRESPAATAAPSPAARACSPTGSSCASPPSPGETFLDRMIALVEGAKRQKTPERDRARHPARGAHHHLPARGRRRCCRSRVYSVEAAGQGRRSRHGAGRAARLPHPDDDRRAARRPSGSPAWTGMIQANVIAMSGRAVEAAGDVDVLLLDKTGTITLGNRQATAFIPAPGVTRGGARRRGPARLARRRDARRAAASSSSRRRSTASAGASVHGARRDVRAVLRPDAHERRRTSTAAQIRKGAADAVAELRRGERGGSIPPRTCRPAVDAIAEAAARRSSWPTGTRGARRDPPQGHRQGRHQGALRRAAPDGHQDRDDHRRQPADRRGHRGRGRRGRLPRRGHAGGQARADPRAPGRRPPGGDDRRRHQRRPGARAGRRRAWR